MPVAAILLAAGASRRLGQPKQLLRLAGETLLDRTIRIAQDASLSPILVVLGANCETIASTADLQNVQVVVNPNWEQGIATSIHAGLNALAKDVSSAMLLVCDQPLLTAQHLRALQTTQSNSSEGAIISSAYAGIHGIPAIFPASQFSRLLALSGDQGARLILRNSDATVISIPFEGGEIDIDTPSDLTDSRWAPSDPQRDEH